MNTRAAYGPSYRLRVRSGWLWSVSLRLSFHRHREGAYCHGVLGYDALAPRKGFWVDRGRHRAVTVHAGRLLGAAGGKRRERGERRKLRKRRRRERRERRERRGRRSARPCGPA